MRKVCGGRLPPIRGGDGVSHCCGGNLVVWETRVWRRTNSSVTASPCHLPQGGKAFGGGLRFMMRQFVYAMFMAAGCRRYGDGDRLCHCCGGNPVTWGKRVCGRTTSSVACGDTFLRGEGFWGRGRRCYGGCDRLFCCGGKSFSAGIYARLCITIYEKITDDI